jgi:hypothetical protein
LQSILLSQLFFSVVYISRMLSSLFLDTGVVFFLFFIN